MASVSKWILASGLISASLCAVEKKNPDHLNVGMGVWDIDRSKHKHWQYLIEYRWDVDYYNVRPLLAFSGTERGEFYLCGGVAYDIVFWNFALTPSFAPGLYTKGGGKSLGYVLEFRSSIELSYSFSNKSRVGLQYYHISNASLGHRNPGAESLILYYAIPIYR